jgi:hypothetical protein
MGTPLMHTHLARPCGLVWHTDGTAWLWCYCPGCAAPHTARPATADEVARWSAR